MYFEYNLARMLLGLGDLELKKLQQSYHLVFASSWSPTDYALLCLAGAKLTESLFVQVSNHQEEWQVKELHPNLISTGLLPCDWINPEVFTPKKFEERETDIIMVANWGEFKRHWEFFKALGELPDHLSVVLIGQKEGGRDMGYIQRLAQFYGVRQRLSFYESLGINEVSNHLCNAKVALIFSRREGGCVAAVEALFAGCALGMRADAHVGSAAHINRRTGLLLRPGHLGGDLLRLLELAPELEPREWAVESITHEITRARLNETVRNSEISAGRPWTHDLAQIEWRPYASYSRVVDQERFLPDYEFLNEVDPAVFGGLLEQFGGRRSVAVAKAG
ncbi:glycosyltransferase [Phragmitibacter flavus]|nr:glycosyltransferase [Phragmitibacter flavus]